MPQAKPKKDTMTEKIILSLVAALIGGAGNELLESRRTAGRLDSIEQAVKRIEGRLDAFAAPHPGARP